MGCASSRDDAVDFADDDFGDDSGFENLDDLHSQPGDQPLVSIDPIGTIDFHTTGDNPLVFPPRQHQLTAPPATVQQRRAVSIADAPAAPLETEPSMMEETFAAALATSMGSSRRRWDDGEEEEEDEDVTSNSPRTNSAHLTSGPKMDQRRPLPIETPAPTSRAQSTTSSSQVPKKLSFMTAGTAFKSAAKPREDSVGPSPTAPPTAPVPAPLAAPPRLVAQLSSVQSSVLSRSPSTAFAPHSPWGTLTFPTLTSSNEWVPCEAFEQYPLDLLIRKASESQKGMWLAIAPIGQAVMGRLTHPGRKAVEAWLCEIGSVPDVVLSLVAMSPGGSQQNLTRRSLNSNDRIIRSIVERRRPSSVMSHSDDDDDGNNRRRSSARVRPQHTTVRSSASDDIQAELAELQEQADVCGDDCDDNSSKNTLHSQDGVRSTRHPSLSVIPGMPLTAGAAMPATGRVLYRQSVVEER